MIRILMVSERPGELEPFTKALTDDHEVELDWAGSGQAALQAAAETSPLLAVIDRSLPDMDPLELVSRLLEVNAFINTAVISRMEAHEFHEASEGLGILAQLPSPPGPGEAQALWESLDSLAGGMTGGQHA